MRARHNRRFGRGIAHLLASGFSPPPPPPPPFEIPHGGNHGAKCNGHYGQVAGCGQARRARHEAASWQLALGIIITGTAASLRTTSKLGMSEYANSEEQVQTALGDSSGQTESPLKTKLRGLIY